MPTETGNEESSLTKEEKAFLIKALWKALQSPSWTKDNLIELGKAIFAKQTLKEMPDARFEIIYPKLVSIAESLGVQLAEQAASMQKKEDEEKEDEGEGEGEGKKGDEKKEEKK